MFVWCDAVDTDVTWRGRSVNSGGTTSCTEFLRQLDIFSRLRLVELPSSQLPETSPTISNDTTQLPLTQTHKIQLLFSGNITIMDREYIQYVKQEAAASVTRAIARALAVTIYGVTGVYLLSTILTGVLPKVAAFLPLGSNAAGCQDDGGVDLLWRYMSVKWCWWQHSFCRRWWGEEQKQQLCIKYRE